MVVAILIRRIAHCQNVFNSVVRFRRRVLFASSPPTESPKGARLKENNENEERREKAGPLFGLFRPEGVRGALITLSASFSVQANMLSPPDARRASHLDEAATVSSR